MTSRSAPIVSFIGFLFFAIFVDLYLSPALSAAPPALAPTEEPTKPPYIFPTPIFIPTYPSAGTTSSSPTPIATRAIPVTSSDRTYTVESGDNPWTIAAKVYGSGAKYPAILSANGLTENSKLKIGQVLRIPSSDSSGQALPTPAPTTAPTVAPTPPTPAAPPVQATSPAAPTAVRTATPTPVAGSSLPSVAYDAAGVAINLFSAVFLLGSIGSATLAFLVHRRSDRSERMTLMVRRIRTK